MATLTEIDYTLLEGMDFTCLEGCAFCCSFPAEVRECEQSFNAILNKDPQGLKKWETDDPYFCNVYTMKQHKDRGACVFLRDDRRCGIYSIRSLLCRIFPIKVFFGWRVQLYTSHLCRGFSYDGSRNLRIRGEEIMEQLPTEIKEEMMVRGKEMYEQLATGFDRYISPAVLQERLSEHASNMDINGQLITERNWNEFIAQLSSENFIDLPAYLTEDMQWNVFRLCGKHVEILRLEHNGDISSTGSIRLPGPSLRPITPEAIDALREYVQYIVRLDHFAGVVYRRALQQDTGYTVLELAKEYLADIVANFLVKADLLAEFNGRSRIDASVIRETIIFTDAYLATEPCYGLIL